MNTQTQKIQQDKINADVAAFLGSGGAIQRMPDYGAKAEYFNPMTKGRKPAEKRTNKERTKKSVLAAQARKTLKMSKGAYLHVKGGCFYIRNKEMEGAELLQTFTSVTQVNGFDFGKVIEERQG